MVYSTVIAISLLVITDELLLIDVFVYVWLQNDEMIASLPVNGGGSAGGPATRVGRGLTLHRSNSSLELPHSPDPTSRVPESPLRREYGSHGN